MRNREEVRAYLATIPPTATPARKWQGMRVATRRLLKAYDIPGAAKFKVEPLPPQAYRRSADAWYGARRIRYSKAEVAEWLIDGLATTIVHEVAHIIDQHENTTTPVSAKGAKRSGPHGPRWRGIAAALGNREPKSWS